MSALDIAEVARRSGVPASALRYYEEKGLIASVGRQGLRRLFHADVLERLALIAMGRVAGLSLDEIAQMFSSDGRLQVDRTLLTEKARELDETIARLTAMRDGMRHVAACAAPDHMACPKFRRILKAVASGAKAGRTADPASKLTPRRAARQP